MTVTTKYNGNDTLIFWIPTGSAAINLTGTSRDIEINEKGSSIDVSTRDDLQAGAKQKLSDIPDRTFNASGLDTTPSGSRLWRTIAVGDTGSLLMYPLGSVGSGKPVETATGVITGRDYKSPIQNAATWKLDGELTSVIAATLTA